MRPCCRLEIENHISFEAVGSIDKNPQTGGEEFAQDQAQKEGCQGPVNSHAAVAQGHPFENPGHKNGQSAVGNDGVSRRNRKADGM